MVVFDNLLAHRSARVQQLIVAKQCDLWFLPSYTPDLSPSEPAFAKLKPPWRKAQARTVDVLYDTLAASLPTITLADAAGFFAGGSYHIRQVA